MGSDAPADRVLDAAAELVEAISGHRDQIGLGWAAGVLTAGAALLQAAEAAGAADVRQAADRIRTASQGPRNAERPTCQPDTATPAGPRPAYGPVSHNGSHPSKEAETGQADPVAASEAAAPAASTQTAPENGQPTNRPPVKVEQIQLEFAGGDPILLQRIEAEHAPDKTDLLIQWAQYKGLNPGCFAPALIHPAVTTTGDGRKRSVIRHPQMSMSGELVGWHDRLHAGDWSDHPDWRKGGRWRPHHLKRPAAVLGANRSVPYDVAFGGRLWIASNAEAWCAASSMLHGHPDSVIGVAVTGADGPKRVAEEVEGVAAACVEPFTVAAINPMRSLKQRIAEMAETPGGGPARIRFVVVNINPEWSEPETLNRYGRDILNGIVEAVKSAESQTDGGQGIVSPSLDEIVDGAKRLAV